MKIIALSAKAQHGKDQSAKLLKEIIEASGKTCMIFHYADPLKWVLRQYYDWDGQKDEKGRHLLQYVGTNVCRASYENTWVDIIRALIKGFSGTFDYAIIVDCRFPNEINWITEAPNGYTIRINRPDFDNGLTDEAKNHPSETSLDDYEFLYHVNNSGTIDDLKMILEIIYQQIDAAQPVFDSEN